MRDAMNASTTNYGNVFLLEGGDVIRLTIERPNVARSTEATFRYEHAVDH